MADNNEYKDIDNMEILHDRELDELNKQVEEEEEDDNQAENFDDGNVDESIETLKTRFFFTKPVRNFIINQKACY